MNFIDLIKNLFNFIDLLFKFIDYYHILDPYLRSIHSDSLRLTQTHLEALVGLEIQRG